MYSNGFVSGPYAAHVDENGASVPAIAMNLVGGTLTLDYLPSDFLTIRLDNRLDWSSREIFNKVKQELWPVSKVERDAKMEGRRMTLVLQPDHKPAGAKPPVKGGTAPGGARGTLSSGSSLNIPQRAVPATAAAAPAAAPAPAPQPAGAAR